MLQVGHDIVHSCDSSHMDIVMWLVSPCQQQQLMTLADRDSSISPVLPQRLLVPVLQMLHDGPGSLRSPEWPAVTASAQGLSDEFSRRFNYAAIHSATLCVCPGFTARGLQCENINMGVTPQRKRNHSGLRFLLGCGHTRSSNIVVIVKNSTML